MKQDKWWGEVRGNAKGPPGKESGFYPEIMELCLRD